MNSGDSKGSDVLAELNDLLQLDRDAIQSYTIAIDNLQSEPLRARLIEFREDHERHVRDLSALIQQHGGEPATSPHLSSGIFKLIMQQEGRVGGDRELLMAYKTNEGQARDKYARHAERRHAPHIDDVIRRNAADEVRHYNWAEQTLAAMGAGGDTVIGSVQRAAEAVQGGMADVLEGAAREATKTAERMRRSREGK